MFLTLDVISHFAINFIYTTIVQSTLFTLQLYLQKKKGFNYEKSNKY